MGNLFERLKDYFENTPKDVIEKDWREIEYLNEIGPDVIEYAEFVSVRAGENGIAADAKYCLAA